MLQNLSKKVRLCMRKAEESANHAKFEADPDLVRDLLAMEQCWLKRPAAINSVEFSLLGTVSLSMASSGER
jgi:hypothetical protein